MASQSSPPTWQQVRDEGLRLGVSIWSRGPKVANERDPEVMKQTRDRSLFTDFARVNELGELDMSTRSSAVMMWGDIDATQATDCFYARCQASPYERAIGDERLNKGCLVRVTPEFAHFWMDMERTCVNAEAKQGTFNFTGKGEPKEVYTEDDFAMWNAIRERKGQPQFKDAYEYLLSKGDIVSCIRPMQSKDKSIVEGEYVMSVNAKVYTPPRDDGTDYAREPPTTLIGAYTNRDPVTGELAVDEEGNPEYFAHMEPRTTLEVEPGDAMFGVLHIKAWRCPPNGSGWRLSVFTNQVVTAHPESDIAKMCKQAAGGSGLNAAPTKLCMPVRGVARSLPGAGPPAAAAAAAGVGSGSGFAAGQSAAAQVVTPAPAAPTDADGFVMPPPPVSGGTKREREEDAHDEVEAAVGVSSPKRRANEHAQYPPDFDALEARLDDEQDETDA